ncbi:MAG: hypothetical protein ACRC42_01570 [Mycoplasma sp.]
MGNTLAKMDADRLNEIQTLAYQLEDRDFDKSYKNQQLAMQQKAQRGYQNAQLGLSREQFNAQQSWYDKENSVNANQAMADCYYVYNDPNKSLKQKAKDYLWKLQWVMMLT